MSASINRVTLVGNLGMDPEIRTTQQGKAVGEFSVATSYGMGDKEETEWHKIVVWEKTAEACAKFLKKGSSVYVEGRIKTESYEKDGVKKYITKIIANEVKFLGGKADGAAPSAAAPPAGARRMARGQSNSPALPNEEFPF